MPACTPSGDWWGTAAIQQLQMIHRGFGIVVAIVTTIAAIQVLRTRGRWPRLRVLAMLAPLLVLGQIASASRR